LQASIRPDTGSSADEYRRGYKVDVSWDGYNWRTVADGRGTGPVVEVNFPITEARYIRVTLTESSVQWWSIDEIRVFE